MHSIFIFSKFILSSLVEIPISYLFLVNIKGTLALSQEEFLHRKREKVLEGAAQGGGGASVLGSAMVWVTRRCLGTGWTRSQRSFPA